MDVGVLIFAFFSAVISVYASFRIIRSKGFRWNWVSVIAIVPLLVIGGLPILFHGTLFGSELGNVAEVSFASLGVLSWVCFAILMEQFINSRKATLITGVLRSGAVGILALVESCLLWLVCLNMTII